MDEEKSLIAEDKKSRCCNTFTSVHGESYSVLFCYIMVWVFGLGAVFCFLFGLITLVFLKISIFILLAGTLVCAFCWGITFCWLNTRRD